MAYLLIPQATDELSVSQGQILTNFTDANTIFGVNHTDFLSNGGKHKFLQMPNQVTNTVTTLATEAGLYSAQGLTSAVTELFFVRQGFTAGAPGANPSNIAFTETVTTGTIGATTLSGWTRLPSGLLLQWGSVPITVAATGYAVTFKMPFLSVCYGVWVQEIVTNNATHNTFQVNQAGIIAAPPITGCTIYSKDGNGNAGTAQGIYFALGI